MLAFDADQLSFKALSKEDITWVTIKGNHVPIPAHGSREEKAKAIKEWFASKKKELPQAKGRVSYYSAKVEHEAPKKTARASGEGAQVHGEGQYTLKNAENNYENYFKKFMHTKTLATSLTGNEERALHGWYSRLYGSMNNVNSAKKLMASEVEAKRKELPDLEKERESYRKYSNMTRAEAEAFLGNTAEVEKAGLPSWVKTPDDLWRWANNSTSLVREQIKNKENYMRNTEEAMKTLERYINEGKIWEESALYTAGGKLYRKDEYGKNTISGRHYYDINRLYKKNNEEREQFKRETIAEFNEKIDGYKDALKDLNSKQRGFDYYYYKSMYENAIKMYEKEKKWWEDLDVTDIKPAMAQMSMVELPASKTYLREATSLRKQSPHVKQGIKSALVNSYKINELRDMGLPEIADEFESIIDDAIGLNKNHSTPQHIETLLDNTKNRYSVFMTNGSTMYGTNAEKNKNIEKAEHLIKTISDRLKYTLLAENDKKETVIANGRVLYHRIGRYLANEKTKSYWGASERAGQLAATTALSKYGISGIAYTGHGVSKVSGYKDDEGNVTFDPAKIKVLKRTTSVEEIQNWIKKQKTK